MNHVYLFHVLAYLEGRICHLTVLGPALFFIVSESRNILVFASNLQKHEYSPSNGKHLLYVVQYKKFHSDLLY